MWKIVSLPGFTHAGNESYVGGEPFAVTQEPSRQCRVWLKQELPMPPPDKEEPIVVFDEWDDGIRYTPEAQKVQDEAKAKRYMSTYRIYVDAAIETARIQAIKDVGKWASQNFQHWYRAALVTESNIDSLNDGKIPE